jgi:hypothetical protein
MHARLLAAIAALLIGCGGIAVIDADGSTSSSSSSSSSSTGGGGAGGSDPNCRQGGSSTLDGVEISFPPQRCTYTLAEARAGITFRYQVLIGTAVDGIVSQPQDGGGCGVPSNSGLFIFEQLSGNGQSYCLCDTGLCMPPPTVPINLLPSSYDGDFHWTGLNWFGPSDTGNPPGPPFPPGTYTLEVSTRGFNSDATRYDVIGTFELTLVP